MERICRKCSHYLQIDNGVGRCMKVPVRSGEPHTKRFQFCKDNDTCRRFTTKKEGE